MNTITDQNLEKLITKVTNWLIITSLVSATVGFVIGKLL